MRAYDIIKKKRDGSILSENEINFLISGYVNGDVPDYQIAAFLMAVYFKNLNENETFFLTKAMVNSGEKIDLSDIRGITADKHSTGGVGDKTSLIVVPLAATCGLKIAKMSGRGLGHTGGTIDKYESIPGMRLELENCEFINIVNKVGCCNISQSGNLVPADKKIYALRDLTATVDSLPLIAASVMSKKIATGTDVIVLDIKCGSGAFMKTLSEAHKLAKIMISIAKKFGKTASALITDMDSPLGYAIGNSLEIIESIKVLKNENFKDLREISLQLVAAMMFSAGMGTFENCYKIADHNLKNGAAFEKFKEMIAAQGGEISFVENTEKLPISKEILEIKTEQSGYIASIDAEKIGNAAMILGAGRAKKEDKLDYGAGIILNKKIGDPVNKNEVLATFYTSDKSKFESAKKIFKESIKISENKPKEQKLILDVIF